MIVPKMAELISLFEELMNDVHFNPAEKEKIPQLIQMDQKELHISLSRTLYLREHQIHPFVDRLKSSLTQKIRKYFLLNFTIITRTTLTFSSYCWFLNDEKNRTFLSLKVDSGAFMVVFSYFITLR